MVHGRTVHGGMWRTVHAWCTWCTVYVWCMEHLWCTMHAWCTGTQYICGAQCMCGAWYICGAVRGTYGAVHRYLNVVHMARYTGTSSRLKMTYSFITDWLRMSWYTSTAYPMSQYTSNSRHWVRKTSKAPKQGHGESVVPSPSYDVPWHPRSTRVRLCMLIPSLCL